MNARAESCLRTMRLALAHAVDCEGERDHANAETFGMVAARALEAAIFIDRCAI